MLKLLTLIFFVSTAKAYMEQVHVIGMCRVLDTMGNQLATFPGRRCRFFDDGTFISLGKDSLRGFAPDGGVSWEFPVGEEYSQFSFNQLENTLLVIRTIHGSGDESLLHLLVMSLSGTILHETKLPELIHSPEELNFQLRVIPPRAEKAGSPWLRKGNYILSGSHQGLLVLSPDLKKILHVIKIPGARQEHIAGFVFSPEGTLILLNRLHTSSTPEVAVSTIDEYQLSTGKLLFQYPEKPHGLFYIPAGGSVQMTDSGHILLNHPFAGLHLISRKEKKLLYVYQHAHFDNKGLRPPETVWVKDLSRFWKHWKF